MKAGFRFAVAGLLALALLPGAPGAALYNHRCVDGRWLEGKVVSTTYGAYECELKFTGDRVLIKLNGTSARIMGQLDDEVITDPHEIVVHDAKRGVDWTLDCYNLAS